MVRVRYAMIVSPTNSRGYGFTARPTGTRYARPYEALRNDNEDVAARCVITTAAIALHERRLPMIACVCL